MSTYFSNLISKLTRNTALIVCQRCVLEARQLGEEVREPCVCDGALAADNNVIHWTTACNKAAQRLTCNRASMHGKLIQTAACLSKPLQASNPRSASPICGAPRVFNLGHAVPAARKPSLVRPSKVFNSSFSSLQARPSNASPLIHPQYASRNEQLRTARQNCRKSLVRKSCAPHDPQLV
jgi:hypothetical protein